MKSIIKYLLITFGVLLSGAFLLFMAAGLFIALNIGPLAHIVVENLTSETLGVEVKIEDMDVKILQKKATVTNITIANPEGFDNPYLLTINTAQIRFGRISQPLIVFKDVLVDQITVNLETKGNTTNLQLISDYLDNNPLHATPQAPLPDPQNSRIIIADLTIAQTDIISTPPNNTGNNITTLTNTTVQDIGKKKPGIYAPEALTILWRDLSRQWLQH